MTTNLQDTGNLRSIAHKLFKKILKPFSAHYSAECEQACKAAGQLQSREKMENQTNRLYDIVQLTAAVQKKKLFKSLLPMKTCVFTPVSYTQ